MSAGWPWNSVDTRSITPGVSMLWGDEHNQYDGKSKARLTQCEQDEPLDEKIDGGMAARVSETLQFQLRWQLLS
jgi:hypothetical protein